MTSVDRVETWGGVSIVEWTPGVALAPGQGARVSVRYGAPLGTTAATLVAQLADSPYAATLPALVIGPWDEELFERNPDDVVEALLAAKDRFAALAHLFVGDIVMEENEISWIEQTELGPLVNAFPALVTFGVRGGNKLGLTGLSHASLRALVVQTGGLPATVVAQLCAAKLPALEHLELWFGDVNYGGDVKPADVLPLLSGRILPSLKYLGLRNSQVTDGIAKALADAPVLAQIETLDLSMGTLGDEGAEALLASPHVPHLKSLVLAHHYMTPAVVARVAAIAGPKVDVSNALVADRDGDEAYRYVEVSE